MIAAVGIQEENAYDNQHTSATPKGGSSGKKLLSPQNDSSGVKNSFLSTRNVDASGSFPKGKESLASSNLDSHLLKEGKRLTEAEKSVF